MPRGQLSLEYIIILAAFLSFLLFLVPQTAKLQHLAAFTADIRNAEAFMHEFASSAHTISLLGEGSTRQLTARAINSWELYTEGQEVVVIVSSPELGKSKRLSAELHAEIIMEHLKAEGQLRLQLSKKNGAVLVTDS